MNRREIEMYFERMEALKAFMESNSLEHFQEQIFKVKDFLTRFDSLDSLVEQLKVIESIAYTIKEYLTIDEAARFLGISKSQVYKMTSSKAVTVYKPTGKGIYIQRDELINWIKRNPILSNEEIDKKVNLKIFELEKERQQKGDKK